MKINNVVIIMNNIKYIYTYDKLKYGQFIDSLLTATRYYSFYKLKKSIRSQIFRGIPTHMPLVK